MAKPLQTVGSLVQRYRDIGKTEDQIAAEFEKFYGAPHWNLPSDTPLRQARLQSPREIKKRGTPMPGSYEEIFFPPEQRAFAKAQLPGAVEQLTPPTEPAPEELAAEVPEAPPPSGPSLDETSDSGEAAEFQQAEREIADAVRESMTETEIRGGLMDLGESAKRDIGFLKGLGSKLWEMTPFAEEGPPPEYGTDIGAEETIKQYNERKAREAQARQEFEKVQQDPKHGVMDLVRATPAWKNMIAGQEERATRADKPGLTGIAGRLGNAVADIGDLVMFLPRLGYAPFSSFEVQKSKTSEEHGKQVGQETPTAMGVAMLHPYLEPRQSFKVAPMSTIFAWLPALQAFGKGLKALPGVKNLSFQRLDSAAHNVLPKAFAGAFDAVAKKLGGGITTQTLMDRFYNGDPAVTALLEEAFGQDAEVQRAVGELSDILASQRTKEIGVQAAINEAEMAGNFTEADRLRYTSLRSAERKVNAVLQDIATSLKRVGYKKPDGTPFANIDEMVQHLSDILNVQSLGVADAYALHDPKTIMTALNGDKAAFNVLQAAMKEEPGLTWDMLRERLVQTGLGPGDAVYDNLLNASQTLQSSPIDLKPAMIRQLMGNALRAEAEAASQRNASQVLGREAGKYSPPPAPAAPGQPAPAVSTATPQSVLAEFQRTKQLPQVLNVEGRDLGRLIIGLKAEGSPDALKLASHIEQMRDLRGIDGATHGTAYVTWLQDQNTFDRAMSSGVAQAGKEINALIKANVLPANWKAVVSNLIGNSVAVAAKLGWTTHPMEEMGRTFANMIKYKLFRSGQMAETDGSFRSMRALARSGIINTDAFNADLLKYQTAFEPKSVIGKGAAKIYGAPAKVGGVAMVGADQGAKARVFVSKFDELGNYADKLDKGEFIQYPSGPNTVTRLECIPYPGDDRVANYFRETTYVRDAGQKGGLRQVGQAKEFLRDAGEGGLQFDDAIAKGASKFATDFIFDYDRVPGLIQWQRRAPLVGAASPFSTFAYKALEIPGVKRGLPSAIMNATDGVVSNSSKVNGALAGKAMGQWVKQNYIAAGARATAQDEDRKRMMSFDPSRPDTVQVVGPASGSQLADVTTFTSANWAEGLQTVLMTLSSAAQQLADDKGTPNYDKFVQLTREKAKLAQEGKEPPQSLLDARRNAYLLALGEFQNKALTPEVTPQLMKLAGLGGTVFFDTYANWRDSGKTGKVAPTFSTLTKMIIPGAYRVGIEGAVAENYPVENVPFISDALNEMVEGKMARGVPREGTDPSGFTKDEHVGVRMLLENLTGLQATRVDTQAQAERMKKSMQKELEGKLEVWGKEREARLKLQLGDREGTRESIREKEILKQMIHDTVTMWYEKQLSKGFAGRQR